jgi:hypothetical protein
MKEIHLTKGQVALVDDEDYDALARLKWHARWDKCAQTFYAARSVHGPGRKCTTVRMHRQLLGAAPGTMVDHRNHNGLDNRRANLRLCTRAENARNRIKRLGRSRFKGVVWNVNAWQASITRDGKVFNLGRFAHEDEAAAAYDLAARELHGEFALANGVEP